MLLCNVRYWPSLSCYAMCGTDPVNVRNQADTGSILFRKWLDQYGKGGVQYLPENGLRYLDPRP
eukprot:2810342-Rhodomonas_salina.2